MVLLLTLLLGSKQLTAKHQGTSKQLVGLVSEESLTHTIKGYLYLHCVAIGLQ